MRQIISMFLCGQMALVAQQSPAPSSKITRFETSSQLVVVNVVAKDKSGNSIEGLRASDFTVTEDGKQQQIKVFEFQHMDNDALPAVELKPRPAESGQAPLAAKAAVNTQ